MNQVDYDSIPIIDTHVHLVYLDELQYSWMNEPENQILKVNRSVEDYLND